MTIYRFSSVLSRSVAFSLEIVDAFHRKIDELMKTLLFTIKEIK